MLHGRQAGVARRMGVAQKDGGPFFQRDAHFSVKVLVGGGPAKNHDTP